MTSEQEARKLLFKYNEDLILDEVRDYIKSTYGEHYAGGGKNIKIQDVFEQMDISEEFTRGCAMKYLFRFGKKMGRIGRIFSNVFITFVCFTSIPSKAVIVIHHI